jgi:hypothetical protein
MNTITQVRDFKVQEISLFQVVWEGGMVYEPCQVGEWWVTPSKQYKGKVPLEIKQNGVDLLNSGASVIGFLVAKDMEEIKAEQEKERKRKEARKKAIQTGLGLLAIPFYVMGAGLALAVGAALRFDPMLIAVLEDGRGVCCGIWYD